jgi:endogenous inhibitor of DNA gyrase (YacG/DUF329 family)
MIQSQKEQIAALRANGDSYAKIADTLGISENTVKSYCRRNNLGGNAASTSEAPSQSYCRQCGTALEQIPGMKPRKFCSDQCRAAWWATHPESLNRKAVYRFTCPACGMEFESYGNKGRKYCSHACYVSARFGGSSS